MPYGSRVGPNGKTLEPEPAEVEVVTLVRELRAESLTLAAVCQELSERGLKPRSGGRWYPATIRRIAMRG